MQLKDRISQEDNNILDDEFDMLDLELTLEIWEEEWSLY